MPTWSNWAGTVRCAPAEIAEPATTDELAAVVAGATARGLRVVVVGSGHSCGPVAAAGGDAVLVRPRRLTRLVRLDGDTVTVEGGTRLRDLVALLAAHGRMLDNLGSIAEQTVAGAISTGTHGTGLRHGALDQQVTALTVLDAAGARHHADRDLLLAARVGLGATGVLAEITLRHVPLRRLRAVTTRDTLAGALARLPELLAADHGRFWWFPHTDAAQVWTADRTDEPPTRPRVAGRLTDVLVGNRLHEALLGASVTWPRLQPAVNRAAARWLLAGTPLVVERADRVLTFPILVRQHVSEWAVPIEAAAEAVTALRRLVDRGPLTAHAPVEVRFAPADDAWLSPAHGRDTCHIGVIAYRPHGRDPGHERWFRAVDRLMADVDGRPHWAKEHARDAASLAPLYPRWDDARRVRRSLDPDGLLGSAHVHALLDGAHATSR